ncbi:g9986 [Coccomyxa viridis]|uniref:G9986 protein n=1 Tax=Coccomyxa viridis TaxID=1274662 RepID=A0ABP1G6T5_9CHLO
MHAKPGAKVAGIAVSEGRLNIAVQAQPQDGKANEAVVDYLASVLDIRKRCISLTMGSKSRDKVLKIEGMGGTTAASAITKALQERAQVPEGMAIG